MGNKTREYREKIADAFIRSLEETPAEWRKQWQCSEQRPYNAARGNAYRGINRLYLTYIAEQNQWDDPRWCTFKQAKDNGWHIRKGEKGTQVEYWSPYDNEEKKMVSWDTFQEDDDKLKYSLRAIYTHVFNAAQIEGMPELQLPEKHDIHPAQLIDTISKNMGTEITHDGGNRAYYRTTDDTIHVPEPEYFDDDYAYDCTVLHELSHATGHVKRLNREMSGRFGSEKYAYEELVAELSSCFMSEYLPLEMDDMHFENHKAYIQSWISAIRKEPEVLMRAVKDAEKAADYLAVQGELMDEKEFEKHAEKAFVKKEEKTVESAEDNDLFAREHFTRHDKAYVKEFISSYFRSYDFRRPQVVSGRLLPSLMMSRELEQGGMFESAESCRKWIDADPEAAMNTLYYIKDKYPELADLTPDSDPKKFSLIMMERELYKMVSQADCIDEKWDQDFLLGKREAAEICKRNGILFNRNKETDFCLE